MQPDPEKHHYLLNGAWILALMWAGVASADYIRKNLADLFLAFGPSRPSAPVLAGAAVCTALSAVLLGFALAEGTARRRPAVVLWISLAVSGVAGFLAFRLIRMGNIATTDARRVVVLLAFSLVFGGGLGLGIRLGGGACRPLPLGALLVLPVLATAVVGRALLPALFLMLLLWTAHVIGGLAASLGRRSSANEPGPRFVPPTVTVGLGFVILTFFVSLLAVFGAARSGPIRLLLAALFLSTLPQAQRALRRARDLHHAPPVRPSPFLLAGALASSVLLSVYLVCAAAPETGADAIGARVAVPAAFVRQGTFEPLEFSLWSYGQIGGEALLAACLPLLGHPAAKLLALGVLAVLLITAASLGRSGHGTSDGVVFALPFVASTLVWYQCIWGFVDLLQAFFCFGAVIAAVQWGRDRSVPLWTAGALAGMATAVKLNGAGAILIGAALSAVLAYHRDRSSRKALAALSSFGAAAALVLLPIFFRSWLLTGNAVFPFANGLFKSPLAPPEIPKISFGLGLVWPEVLSVPWKLFTEPHLFGEVAAYNPALLALAGLAVPAVLAGGWSAAIWFLAAGLAGLSWLLTEQNARYSLFVGLLFIAGLAEGIPSATSRLDAPAARAVARTALLGLCLLGFAAHVFSPTFRTGTSWSGPAFPSDYLLRRLGESQYLATYVLTFRTGRFVDRVLHNEPVVAQLGVRDHLYVGGRTVGYPHSIWPVSRLLLGVISPSGDVGLALDELSARGVTHLLLTTEFFPFLAATEAERHGLLDSAFVRKRLRLDFADRGLSLYRILAPPVDRNSGATEKWRIEMQAWPEGPGKEIRHDSVGRVVAETAATEGRLYKLELVNDSRSPRAAGEIWISWLGSSGRLLMTEGRIVPAAPHGGISEFFQTAPEETTRVVVRLKNMRVTQFLLSVRVDG